MNIEGGTMDEPTKDYDVGYAKPPLATRFQRGQSGNPGGRRRGAKSLAALLGEALSQRSGLPNPDGSWMTQAEAIFSTLVAQATGPDLKAKRLLFEILIKLQRANICWESHRLPEIQLDDTGGDARAQVAAEIEHHAERMLREAAAQNGAVRQPPADPAPPAAAPIPSHPR